MRPLNVLFRLRSFLNVIKVIGALFFLAFLRVGKKFKMYDASGTIFSFNYGDDRQRVCYCQVGVSGGHFQLIDFLLL